MKPLVIYHTNCVDGFGAAFAAWLKLGYEAEYMPMQYGEEAPAMEEVQDREVYILDFSFSREVMDMIFEQAKRVVWLDHHKTAFEMWCKTERIRRDESWEPDDGLPYGESMRRIILDANKSGAMLAWEHFHPNTEVPMLIKHNDWYNRWLK